MAESYAGAQAGLHEFPANSKAMAKLGADSMRAQMHGEVHLDTPPTTPTALSSSAHHLFAEANSIHERLHKVSSLAPGDQVNTLLSRLVSLCIPPYDPELVTYFNKIDGIDTLRTSLRTLCSTAEGELEAHWALRILHQCSSVTDASSQGQAPLERFPYYRNYLDLTRLEASLLRGLLPTSIPPRRIAFIGSGPLPLTSFCLVDEFPGAVVHNIDRDAAALATSQALANALGYALRTIFACVDVSVGFHAQADETDWYAFDVVFLAALVGIDSASKLAILKALAGKLRPGALVVARSARGLRTLLYPVLELSDELQRIGYEVLVEAHPWTGVVNSVVVLRVKGSP